MPIDYEYVRSIRKHCLCFMTPEVDRYQMLATKTQGSLRVRHTLSYFVTLTSRGVMWLIPICKLRWRPDLREYCDVAYHPSPYRWRLFQRCFDVSIILALPLTLTLTLTFVSSLLRRSWLLNRTLHVFTDQHNVHSMQSSGLSKFLLEFRPVVHSICLHYTTLTPRGKQNLA